MHKRVYSKKITLGFNNKFLEGPLNPLIKKSKELVLQNLRTELFGTTPQVTIFWYVWIPL